MTDDIIMVKREDEEFPSLLAETPSPPDRLFIRGSLRGSEPCVAVVGTRKPTPYGRECAKYFADALTRSGFTVVSGLALGIDAIAHRAALDAGGRTIAVLGCGVDRIYPEENRRLGEEIISRGTLVSEFEPGTPPLPHHFPQRNRLISGLSLGVLVVEAGKESGALITASFAAEQNRDVFAIPGPINSPMSLGTNGLIQEGAKLVREPEDILKEFTHLQLPLKTRPGFLGQNLGGLDPSTGLRVNTESIDKTGEPLLILLREEGPMAADALARKSGSPIHRVQAALTMLELAHLVKRREDGTYQLANKHQYDHKYHE